MSRIASLLSNDFDDDSFGALPIEFAGEEARPAAKVDSAIGDGQNDLMMQQEVLRWASQLSRACLVMAIGGMKGCEVLGPFHDGAARRASKST